jgi:hypothetical protein
MDVKRTPVSSENKVFYSETSRLSNFNRPVGPPMGLSIEDEPVALDVQGIRVKERSHLGTGRPRGVKALDDKTIPTVGALPRFTELVRILC